MSLSFIPPQLPTLMERPPKSSDWIHEIKYDGYLTQLIIEDGSARIFTRNGHDWTAPYQQSRRLRLACASRPRSQDANPDYPAFRRAAATKRSNAISLVAFDLL